MNREDALSWLNHRLHIFERMGRLNHFEITDVTFFMTFIHERTGKNVSIDKIKNSITYYPNSCMRWVDKLTNYLVFTYKIKIESEKINSGFNSFMGVEGERITKYL